jgi:tripartite-type tricarboxylate transporter receptor subunit TctC
MNFLALLWMVLGALSIVHGAMAQGYPAKPVRIVVPAAPGGGVDFVARLVGQRLTERLGQQFLVENRAGGGSVIGTVYVARAAPDGYTLLLGFSGPLAITPQAEKVAYDPRKDFTGVSLLTSFHLMLAVHPSLPVRSVKQLVALARARPGELNYASPNIWTMGHLAPELLKSVTGINVLPVHYKGTGPAAIAVLAGEAHMLYAGPPALLPHLRAKRLVALAVAGPARLALAPDVPTLTESGVRGADAPSWQVLLAPAATPGEIVSRLHGEVVRIAALPDYRAALEKQALEPATSTPDEFAAFLRSEYDKWGRVIGVLKAKDAFTQ